MLITLALLAGAVAVTLLVETGPLYRRPDALGFALPVVAALGFLWRTRAPMALLVFEGVVLSVNAAAGYSVVFVQWTAWVAVFAFHSLDRRWTAGGLLTLAAVGGWAVFDHCPPAATDLAGVAMCLVLSTTAGVAARNRRAVVLMEERVRLARELHDSLGHTVNVMVMQAGAGRRVPAFGEQALGHIEELGRGALDELDRLLHVLDPSTELDTLAARVRAAGRELVLDAGGVPLTTNGYRIVQEAVTNALRHTAEGRISVVVGRRGGGVEIQVTNEGRFGEPVPGRGLANMRARAEAEHGTLQAGPTPGGFLVRAVLPA
ncbi:sensor histidine kinase [Herbidospora cretacea]|uniref:sensor histidine kinase n=1 Tax=Herbidospora cretacea TaxID=28444 RepID=UPI000773FF60|nr:histidine kinase [Herbidospora cretacea]